MSAVARPPARGARQQDSDFGAALAGVRFTVTEFCVFDPAAPFDPAPSVPGARPSDGSFQRRVVPGDRGRRWPPRRAHVPRRLLMIKPAAIPLLVLAWAACTTEASIPAVEGGASCEVEGRYTVDGVYDDFVGDETVLVNGFPVGKSRGFMASLRAGTRLTTTATPALVSGENVAAVSVVPFLRRFGDGVVASAMRLRVWVCDPSGAVVPGTEASSDSAFAAFEAALQEQWPRWAQVEDSLLAARPSLAAALADSVAVDPEAAAYGIGPALDSARAWARAHPVVVATRFVRPDGAPSFDAVFREAPVIGGTPADSARLRAYAVQLRDLLDAADAEGVYREIGPAIDSETGTYQVTMEGTPERDLDDIRQEWTRFRTDFDGSDVGLRSWSGGRVWEVYRDDEAAGALGKQALLLRGDNRLETWLRIYVGEVDGALRVVRITS